MKILDKKILIKCITKTSKLIRIDSGDSVKNKVEIEKIMVELVGLNVNDPNDCDRNIEPGDEVLVNPLKLFDVAYNVNQFFPNKAKNEFYIVIEREDILLIK